MNTSPPDSCAAWTRLAAHAESWQGTRTADLFDGDPRRGELLTARAPGLRFDYSRQRVNALTLRLLVQLAEERSVGEWRDLLLDGAPINTSENRAAGHTALRAGAGAPAEVHASLDAMRAVASEVAAGRYQRVINLGVGGSDLGPRLVADALRKPGLPDVRFVANVDPLELDRALEGADPASTLFIVASKSYGTQETLMNAARARRWMGTAGDTRNIVAATANATAAKAAGAGRVVPMPEWVGGRFSLWSAPGLAAMCAIGVDAFDELLEGAREADEHFATAPLDANVPVLMALLGVWNVDFLGHLAHAVLPYSHALRLLPAWMQQLDMESNGKRVDHDGRPVAYHTSPVVFGAEGSVGQHSFHQLLHQGTHVVPADFVVLDRLEGDAGHVRLLAASAEAQAEALLRGTSDPDLPPWRQHPGNRPSNLLHLEALDPRNLGRLLATYEHKAFTQGVLWNVNSFDQWGVELGKQLAARILGQEA